MVRSKKQVKLVFRKPNPGNYSIESIYKTLREHWASKPEFLNIFSKVTLKRNYDFGSFFGNFFINLFIAKYTVHITGGCNYMVLAFPFKKRLLTIHDVYNLTKQRKGNRLYKWLYYDLPIRFSHHIVAVSQQTRADLIGLFPKAEQKIVIIQNPMVLPIKNTKDPQRASHPSVPITILQIGSKPLKNYERLLEATQGMDVNYLFVHGNPTRIIQLIDKHNIGSRSTVYSALSNNELAALYLRADILYFASLAEGFGMPLVEAQAFGLPIITSTVEPMQTLAPYAIKVDPLQTTAIREAILCFVNQGVKPAGLNAARDLMDKYNVQSVAKQYQQIYF